MSESVPAEDPTAGEAEALLARAHQIGTAAIGRTNWPYAVVLVGLGATTSIGTLAMNLSVGSTYTVVTIAMLVWVAIFAGSLIFAGRVAGKFGFTKRWGRYASAWAVSYGIAIAIATSELRGNVPLACLASALVAGVTVAGWVKEARS
jgi:hypothetical protein